MAEDVFGIVGTVQAGTYRVDSVVAEGGFGVVYRAYHEAFRAPVALKCLKVPTAMAAAHQAEFLEKFRAEGELLFRLSASLPAVVRPLHVDALVSPNGAFVPFMALEWLTGKTLGELVEGRAERGERPMSLDEVLRLLDPIARALAKAHKFPGPHGPLAIVHRDLKPDNIFVADVHGERQAKILDFGIAKARSAATAIVGRQSQGMSSLVAFSPGFAAPEQWVPKRFGQTGPWTDVYSLALTAVECAYGQPVLTGEPSSMMGQTLDEARRPTPRALGIAASDALERVFAKALAVDPKDRYADAGAFWDDLERAMGHAPSSARIRISHSDPPATDGATLAAGHVSNAVAGGASRGAARRDQPTQAAPAPKRETDVAKPPPPASGLTPSKTGGDAIDRLAGGPLFSMPPPSALDKLPSLAPAPPPAPRTLADDGPSFSLGELLPRLVGPIALVLLGLGISALVNVYAGSAGEVPAIGPVRLTTIGGLVAGIGLVLGVVRVVRPSGR